MVPVDGQEMEIHQRELDSTRNPHLEGEDVFSKLLSLQRIRYGRVQTTLRYSDHLSTYTDSTLVQKSSGVLVTMAKFAQNVALWYLEEQTCISTQRSSVARNRSVSRAFIVSIGERSAIRTLTLSKCIMQVPDALIPSLSSGLATVSPGVSRSTKKVVMPRYPCLVEKQDRSISNLPYSLSLL